MKAKLKQKYIIAGIGTEIGKTIASAILTESLEADYWKPVQAGNLENSDTKAVKDLISNSMSRFHPEIYRLHTPASPHAAAKAENISIESKKLILPQTENHLIVELAGGLMVPLNDSFLNIDLIQKWDLPVILIANYYLGSINHTLLSIELLKSRKSRIEGIVLNGKTNQDSKNILLNYSGIKLIGEIAQEESFNKEKIRAYALAFRQYFIA